MWSVLLDGVAVVVAAEVVVVVAVNGVSRIFSVPIGLFNWLSAAGVVAALFSSSSVVVVWSDLASPQSRQVSFFHR